MPLDVEAIRTACPGRAIHYRAVTDSTMKDAALLAQAGVEHGAVIVANEQTAGVGRLGRKWESQPESGVYFSMIVRLTPERVRLPILSLMLGLAAREAIERAASVGCDLRWPNDVLINERKAAGILAQFVDGVVIAGIGINVNQTEFPAGLRTPATSLRIESGRMQSREAVIAELVDAIESLTRLEDSAILDAFTAASSYARNRRVVIEDSGQHGTTAGLDENGFLKVQIDSGRMEHVITGGVRPE